MKDIAVYQDLARMDEICYMPENVDFSAPLGYTHNDLLKLVNNNEKLASQLFFDLDWQHPSTLIDENLHDEFWFKCKECGEMFDMDYTFEPDVWNPRKHPENACPYCNPASLLYKKTA